MGRLLLKENLYLGFRFRLQFAYLIVIKPLLAYMLTYFMYYGDYDIENVFSWVLKVLTLITTIIPMQSMKIFHHTIEVEYFVYISFLNFVFRFCRNILGLKELELK